MNKRKYQLLNALREYLLEGEYLEEAVLFSAEETGLPMDALQGTVLEYGPALIEILAEFAFLPLEEGGEEIWYFSSILTISNQVEPEFADALSIAVARLNSVLGIGAFSVSKNGRLLLYKQTVPCIARWDDKMLLDQICKASDTALIAPESYTQLLLSVATGLMKAEDFISYLVE